MRHGKRPGDASGLLARCPKLTEDGVVVLPADRVAIDAVLKERKDEKGRPEAFPAAGRLNGKFYRFPERAIAGLRLDEIFDVLADGYPSPRW